MAALLDVKDLHVEFTTRDGVVKAVNGITFALERGKVLTILGESGSGKSVTLRSLVRLLPRVRTRLSADHMAWCFLFATEPLCLPSRETPAVLLDVVCLLLAIPLLAIATCQRCALL